MRNAHSAATRENRSPLLSRRSRPSPSTPVQVNDFVADAIISQMLLLDAKDPTKVKERRRDGETRHFSTFNLLSIQPSHLALRLGTSPLHSLRTSSSSSTRREAPSRPASASTTACRWRAPTSRRTVSA